jgi:enoyl-CoA hydratase
VSEARDDAVARNCPAASGAQGPGDGLHVRVDGPLAYLTIDRPDRGHSWLRAMYGEATAHLELLARRDDVRALVIDSTGDKIFSGGADLGELAALRRDEHAIVEVLTEFECFLRAIENAPQVVIAALTGTAVGAGLEIANACDVRVASTNARLGIPAARLGLVITRPDVARLVRVAGSALAAEMLLCARVLTAAEALARGIVSHVCPPDKVREVVAGMAAGIADLSPHSVRAMKRHLLAVSARCDDLHGDLAASVAGLLTADLSSGSGHPADRSRPVPAPDSARSAP